MTGPKGPNRTRHTGSSLFIRVWQTCLVCLFTLLSVLRPAQAAPNFSLQDPLAFYTGVADEMLRNSTALWCAENFTDYTNTFGATTTGGFSLTNIPVFINGRFVYTPAVNRLLQLAANVYDATTSSPFPSVFRPTFWVTNVSGFNNVYIDGYELVTNVTGFGDYHFNPPVDVTALPVGQAGFNSINYPNGVNVYGVPWIIGAKKGLPNFNEFSMINTLAVTRRLQMTRTMGVDPYTAPVITGTNQMYLFSLNSQIGVELWNSYITNYPGTVQIGLHENAALGLTNDDPGFQWAPLAPMTFSTNIALVVNPWVGSGQNWEAFSGNPNSGSFVLPLNIGVTMLTNSVYRSPYAGSTPGAVPAGFTPPCIIPTNYLGNLGWPLLFESNSPNGFYLPQFGLVMTNRLQLFMLDGPSNGVYHIIDYVHFAGPNTAFNVNSNLAESDPPGSAGFEKGVWDTNLYYATSPRGLTHGILNQIVISKNGLPPAEDGNWTPDPGAIPPGAGNITAQQSYFKAFFLPGNRSGGVTNLSLIMQAPYSPNRYIVQYLTWQVNDPLVHFLASDVDYSFTPNIATIPRPGVDAYNFLQTNGLISLNLGQLNDRYAPWGGNPHLSASQKALNDTNLYNLAERDPMMTQSDNWDFPTNPFSNFNWIGRVHRGTPWQTVFLKATNIVANNYFTVWQNWTGDLNYFDAFNTAPIQDWHLASLLTSLLNTNPVGQMMSVNNPNPFAWQALLDGLTAWTNFQPGSYDTLLIWSDSPQAKLIAQAIQATRASQSNQTFGNVGDVLATDLLSDQSPFLGPSTSITDEAYEIIPSQLLSLLRADSSGAAVDSGGQPVINFTGWDGHAYAVQASANLIDWVSVSTNSPVNGTFSFTNAPASGAQFYRTLLLP